MLNQWRRAVHIAIENEPADLLLANARVVNVFTGRIRRASVAIADGRIVGVGDYDQAAEIQDVQGAFVAPSFIDGHIHTESSLLWLPEFAKAVVPHGTGAVVTDPHEIVNVAGTAGFEAMVEASQGLPLGVHFTMPSCVPASPHETAGAVISAEDIAVELDNPATVGLGEMMNFPGVLSGQEDIFDKLSEAENRKMRRDGHAPGLGGRSLDAYILSGPTSDHESTEIDEAREKLERGMMLMLREGSTEHNMIDLLPLVDDETYPRFCFASDDRDCATLLHDGHMNETLRRAVSAGLDPSRAIRMATLSVAEYWRLDRVGAVAPGYEANLVVLGDLRNFEVLQVYFRGRRVAEGGNPEFETSITIPSALLNTVNMAPVDVRQIRLDPADATRAVGAVDGQIVTRLVALEPTIVDGEAVADVDRDLLKLVCVERHNATGNVGVGYITGFGLKEGALASSIAHDAHNIVAVGTNDQDILVAIQTVVDSQGGLAAVVNGGVRRHLALPVAGILSDRPLAETAHDYEAIENVAQEMGSSVSSPFGVLAFMALSVIPEARVTDQGFIELV